LTDGLLTDTYSPEEQAQLLTIARQTLEAVTAGRARPRFDLDNLPTKLCEERACFVTFTINRDLRGCTGTLRPRAPLAEEVSVTTVQTAFHDPRFPAVTANEVPHIHIEISILTPPIPLKFESPDELIRLLRPGIDGVTLQLGTHRSTFLPQVWEHLPSPEEFLNRLSQKMGLAGDSWRQPNLQVEVYQSVIVEEASPFAPSSN
jgi:AmmeMemoRadiSam system protein A